MFYLSPRNLFCGPAEVKFRGHFAESLFLDVQPSLRSYVMYDVTQYIYICFEYRGIHEKGSDDVVSAVCVQRAR